MKKKILKAVSIFMLIIIFLVSLNMALFFQGSTVSFEFFETGLAEEKPNYPISHDGRTFYVAADGKTFEDPEFNSQTGLSEDDPVNIDCIRWLTRGSKERGDLPFFRPGDQILLKRGDVFTTNLEIYDCYGVEGNPITIASYGDSDKRPVIEINQNAENLTDQSGRCAAVNIVRCSNIVVRDLEISVIWGSRKNTDECGYGINVNYDYEDGKTEKYKNVYIANNVVYSNSFFTNFSGINVSQMATSYEGSADDFVLKGLYITNNHVYNVGRTAIVVGGWISDSINEYYGNQVKFTIFNDVHVDNNLVHDAGCMCIVVESTTGCTINRNYVYNGGKYQIGTLLESSTDSPMEGQGGIMVLSVNEAEIKYNEAFDCFRQGGPYDGTAIDIDFNCMNIDVSYNNCYHCDGAGISTMACANSKITHNRVWDIRCCSNQYGQISVSDYLPWGGEDKSWKYFEKNSEDLLSLRNLEVSDNLIKAAPVHGLNVSNEYVRRGMFVARNTNGVKKWHGNSFVDNHVVYTGSGTNFFYNLIEDTVSDSGVEASWGKFANNKYYSGNLSSFICEDVTQSIYDINYMDGASLCPKSYKFIDWLSRDIGSTFQKYIAVNPGKPTNAKVVFKEGMLQLSWDAPSENIWHYNVYKVKEGEEINYCKLIGQPEGPAFYFTPECKGEFYIVIQPEDNMGNLGDLLKIKIKLN